ncbi:metacaspase-2-like [Asterias rubens]|uniref:metacaspase-2-like n=1 Tax=Asterias rubens TaxID=7604 RepID=UPI0014551E05|nr:metacaspase-2-like [Asterias rubens]
MTRIAILGVLVLAAVCSVHGAPKKVGYGPLLREVRQALFQKRGELRSESHYYCWEVLEQKRESICYVPPPATNPPQPTHGHTQPPPTHAPWTDAPNTDAPASHAPNTDAPASHAPNTDAPASHAPKTDAPGTAAPAPPLIPFVGAKEAKGFLIGRNIQDLHEECCWEGCDNEEIEESC